MKGNRRRHEPEFKARVALEALTSIKPIHQIAKDFDLHSVQVSKWKKVMTVGAAEVFGVGRGTTEAQDFKRQRAQLHAKINQQAMALDSLRKKIQTTRPVRDRIERVDKEHPKLSVRKQCVLLGVARSSVDYEPVRERAEDILIKRLLDEIYLTDPCLGRHPLVTILKRDHGITVNHKRLQRLRREIGHRAIYCKPQSSNPEKGRC